MGEEFRLVDAGWGQVLDQALQHDDSSLRIVCPFIKKGPTKRLLKSAAQDIKVITRFNLLDFYNGVSDIKALRMLLGRGAQIRGIRNLHSKVYLFGSSRAIVTSANLTEAALSRNQEFGFVADDPEIISCCSDYIADLWNKAGSNLTMDRLEEWDRKVTVCLAKGVKTSRMRGLGDEGVDVGGTVPPAGTPPWVAETDKAFVKFFGISSLRAERSLPVMAEVSRTGCHWACTYPKNKRPRQVKDGDIMFMARLTKEPNDIIIFGRAVALAHVPGRDDATKADIQLRDFKEKWPHYIRVHHPEFVAGTLENGVSLNELMETLEENAFAVTQENAKPGVGNTDPRRAYMQQAAVRLSSEGLTWLNTKLEAAFAEHGRVPQVDLDSLDWPEVPQS
jgi:hypothetical protein